MLMLKKLTSAAMIFAVLALPVVVAGCAKESATPETPPATETAPDSDLGEPEGGTQL